MIDFELDEERKMLTEELERFSKQRIRGIFRDADEEGCIPDELVKAGRDFGLLEMAIPHEFGGMGEYSSLTGALAMETMAYGDLSTALQIHAPALVAIPLILAGTEEQKEGYLADFSNGRSLEATAALIEPQIKFDARDLSTIATKVGNEYEISGVKAMVPVADRAELFLIYANEDGRTQGFLVSRDTPRLDIGEREKLMGIKALPTFKLTLEACRIPKGNKLGRAKGFDIDLLLNHARVGLAAAAVGVARSCYDYSREYAKERVQFGEPIAHRQSIAFMLAEMAIDVDAARLMVWEAAWKLDRGLDATPEVAAMKYHIDKMVVEVADKAVQILGGYGYIREYPAEMWLRNARGFSSFEGLAIV